MTTTAQSPCRINHLLVAWRTPRSGEFLSSNQNLTFASWNRCGVKASVAKWPALRLGKIKECVTTNRFTFQTNQYVLLLLVDVKGVTVGGNYIAADCTVSVWNSLSYTGVPRLSPLRLFAPCLAVPQPSLAGSEQRTHLATESASIKHQRRNFIKNPTTVKRCLHFMLRSVE